MDLAWKEVPVPMPGSRSIINVRPATMRSAFSANSASFDWRAVAATCSAVTSALGLRSITALHSFIDSSSSATSSGARPEQRL